MRIVTIDVNHPKRLRFPICACIGYFDGMHKGHQALLEKTIEVAREKQCESALITFEPDPWVTIKGMKENELQHITTMQQKINLAIRYGIENIIILEFTKEMCELSPELFVKNVLESCDLKGLICGFDFHYGYMGKGNSTTLRKQANFDVYVVDPVEEEGAKISSTRITLLLNQGKIEEANELLGHPFEMIGKVIPGKHKGTTFGFPTANIAFSDEYLSLKQGVYACYAIVKDKKYKAMVNIGHNPTMNYTEKLSYEAHILDFHEDIYNNRIILQFIQYLRPEMKFLNLNNLIMQLEQDRYTVERILK